MRKRHYTIGICTFLFVMSLATLVYIGVLQQTVFNRHTAKQWIADSGMYTNNVVPALIQAGGKTASGTNIGSTPGAFELSDAAVKTALNNTFTSAFVQQEFESIIDKFYDWQYGKTASFDFSIPIDQKRDTFIAELSAAAEPQVAALPLCSAQLAAGTLCRPANIPPADFAAFIITDKVDRTNLFVAPITAKDATKDIPLLQSKLLTANLMRFVTPALIAAATIAIAALAVIVWLSQTGTKITAIATLGKRTFFSYLFATILSVGIIAAISYGLFTLPATSGQLAVASATTSEFFKLAILSIASWSAILSSLVCLVAIIAWQTARFIGSRSPAQPPQDADVFLANSADSPREL